ncbi:MAG: hypothetical protein IBJ04_04955 [Hydrogenophaga sp.]|uniref:hypothetical protein n=1 Tax=Hydrogenophaga sp. TaxID=1904254 RepID=UPI00257C06FC|nr:hypothetical protein [Hydrogenophaga sp.]MBL0943656.1 hypothetical protein [Hydrogenophaga sp.]
MSSGLLIALEMAGVLLVAVGWGVYELWKLRQWRERDRRARAEAEARAGDEPPR